MGSKEFDEKMREIKKEYEAKKKEIADELAKREAFDRQFRARHGGLACPRCGQPEPQLTCTKGFFGSSPAYECRKCGYKWKFKN